MLTGEHLRIPEINLQSEFIVKTLEEEDRKKKKKEGQPHRHNFFTVIWIHEGSGVHQIDFKDFPIEKGYVHFVSPQQVHWFKNNPGIKGWLFLFNVNFLESCGITNRFMKALGLFTGYAQAEPLLIPENQFERLNTLCKMAQAESDPSKAFHIEMAATYIKQFLIECSRIKGCDKNWDFELHSDNRILQQFLENLEQNFQQVHKVAEYAAMQNITPNYLNEVIKESSGRSAKEHIQNRIILEAMRYATHSDMNTKETAFTLGFDDPAHFSKFFKKCKGIDFTSFRDQIRHKK
ncbi:MAG TPA: helix-turn-helix transcriptional regulator [Bacteroidia bacterium]